MKAVLSGKEMKAFDTRSIRGYGIPSLVLMERAALAVAEKAEEILKREQAETVCPSAVLEITGQTEWLPPGCCS